MEFGTQSISIQFNLIQFKIGLFYKIKTSPNKKSQTKRIWFINIYIHEKDMRLHTRQSQIFPLKKIQVIANRSHNFQNGCHLVVLPVYCVWVQTVLDLYQNIFFKTYCDVFMPNSMLVSYHQMHNSTPFIPAMLVLFKLIRWFSCESYPLLYFN